MCNNQLRIIYKNRNINSIWYLDSCGLEQQSHVTSMRPLWTCFMCDSCWEDTLKKNMFHVLYCTTATLCSLPPSPNIPTPPKNETSRLWSHIEIHGRCVFLITLVSSCLPGGFIWTEIKQMWDGGFHDYIHDWWNLMDFVMNSLYLATISLKIVAYVKVTPT